MNSGIIILCGTAAALGFVHTLLGPDHYLPFIVMNRARKWSAAKTAWITFACGVGHVLSSVVLGLIGIAFGVAVMKLEAFEAFRGNLAAWALIGFGFAYAGWGIHRGVRNRPHTHLHLKGDHSHESAVKANITPWILFTIFVLGPCEPLIPLLMYPAAKESLFRNRARRRSLRCGHDRHHDGNRHDRLMGRQLCQVRSLRALEPCLRRPRHLPVRARHPFPRSLIFPRVRSRKLRGLFLDKRRGSR